MRTLDRAAAPAWLHNMSVPPNSTLTVEREWLGGRCFVVQPAHGTGPAKRDATGRWVATALRSRGSSALLALLLEPLDPPDSWQTRVTRRSRSVQREGNVRARLDAALDAALLAAGVPQRVGAFVPRGDTPVPDATPLGFAASLAVLGRRSGPLYLPSRRVDGSLVELVDVLLVFPGETSSGTRPLECAPHRREQA
jgi:hypothetical protein